MVSLPQCASSWEERTQGSKAELEKEVTAVNNCSGVSTGQTGHLMFLKLISHSIKYLSKIFKRRERDDEWMNGVAERRISSNFAPHFP